MATAAVAAFSLSGCSLSNQYPYYYDMIVESPPLTMFDLYAWVDGQGNWMTGAVIERSLTVQADEIMVM